ncbi:peptidoglycan-binding protein [Chthonobacter rhizosphaerae]|uniref:peptidoglycan-binding protein n=1 Tax=Chthonobacter rhizosphaerae TaxID=2735553 RepID=UPI0015EE47B9|nr:peptidoglycan-binding protein [Chthonobacter rhizosphaerae]
MVNNAYAAPSRVALVLAVEEYPALQASPVGTKRAAAISEALTGLGFQVIESANPGNATARAKLREFAEASDGAEMAIAVLLGHGTTWSGQSFFLPANTDIGRPTDLLSRALSVGNVAQIAGRAKAGGVFYLATTPRFATPVQGLEVRPQVAAPGQNGVVVLSASPSVPVSQLDLAAEKAADALIEALRAPQPTLAGVAAAVAGDGRGAVIGTAPDVPLEATEPVEAEAPAPVATVAPDPPPTAADDGMLEAERLARERAETEAEAERGRAEEARLAAEKAQADVERAQAEARKAQADAEKAQADARKAQADAARALAEAERTKAEALQNAARSQVASTDATGALPGPIDERELGRWQRQQIQQKLRGLGLYTGPIDSIMGPLTREAIMGFQKSRQAAVTGYLTADQYDALLASGE